MLRKRNATTRIENSKYHGEPAAVPADDGAPWRTQRRRRNQRLNFNKYRPRTFDAGENSRTGCIPAAITKKELRRITHFLQPTIRHLEHANFVRRTEAVFDGTQQPEGITPVTLEIEHRVDHVLDHLGPRNLTFLGDMTDKNHRGTGLLGEPYQALRGSPHLADRARRCIKCVRPERLNRIDNDKVRPRTIRRRRQNISEVGL